MKFEIKDYDGRIIGRVSDIDDAIFFAETKGYEVWRGTKCIYSPSF